MWTRLEKKKKTQQRSLYVTHSVMRKGTTETLLIRGEEGGKKGKNSRAK